MHFAAKTLTVETSFSVHHNQIEELRTHQSLLTPCLYNITSNLLERTDIREH